MKVKFWVYIANQSDGSAMAHFFNSKKAAEKYAEHDDERYCDDIYSDEFEVNSRGKIITNPVHWTDESEVDEDE